MIYFLAEHVDLSMFTKKKRFLQSYTMGAVKSTVPLVGAYSHVVIINQRSG